MTQVCSQCKEEATEDHFETEETDKGERRRCPKTNKFANLIDKEELQPNEPTEMETPNSCLRKALERDPKLKDNDDVVEWIMSDAKDEGYMTTEEVREEVQMSGVSKPNITAKRVGKIYMRKLEKALKNNRALAMEDIWKTFLKEEEKADLPDDFEEAWSDRRIDVDDIFGEISASTNENKQPTGKKNKIRGNREAESLTIDEMIEHKKDMEKLKALKSGALFGGDNSTENKEIKQLRQEIREFINNQGKSEVEKLREELRELKKELKKKKKRVKQRN